MHGLHVRRVDLRGAVAQAQGVLPLLQFPVATTQRGDEVRIGIAHGWDEGTQNFLGVPVLPLCHQGESRFV